MLKSMKIRRKLIIKVLFLCMVFYTIFHTTTQSLKKPTVNQYKLNLQRQIKLQFKSWYSNFLAANYQLDTNRKFNNGLDLINQQKLRDDIKHELWDINPQIIQNLPLDLSVPSYYLNSLISKPRYQPFDPRFTLSIYLYYILQNPDQPVPFHWSDWIDLTKLNKYILSLQLEKPNCKELFDISDNKKLVENSKLKKLKDYCVDDIEFPLGYRITDFSGPQTIENHEILSKSHLYLGFPPPLKIIFLTELQGSYEVIVKDKTNDLKKSLLHNNMVESVLKSLAKTNLYLASSTPVIINPLKAFKTLLKDHPPSNSHEVLNDSKINIPRESFDIDASRIVKFLKKKDKKKLSRNDQSYLESLEVSLDESNPPKFFKECKLLEKTPQKWLGEHYDWRFFNGLTVGGAEQMLSLHRLVVNYLNFARQHGLITWIAHGSLLSWYWNGIAFPWDTDIDVQMPIADLHKLSQRFNQTMIVENIGNKDFEFSGMGKYFIDVGSSITHRSKGNGNNNIDARFIDVDTGLYIDITGLALTETPAPSRYDILLEIDEKKQQVVRDHTDSQGQMNHKIKNEQLMAYNCRNNHFNTYDELSPLLLTAVENQPSYVPSNFIMTLNYEYGLNGLTEKNFKDYIYLNNFRIWVKTQIILDYLNDPHKWIDKFSTLPPNEKALAKSKTNNNHKKQKRIVGALEKFQINQLSLQDHLNLLQNNKIFKEYVTSRQFTNFHEQQLKELSKTSNDIDGNNDGAFANIESLLLDYSHNDDSKNSGGLGKRLGQPLRADLFMYKVFKDDWNYTTEVNHVIKLNSVYHDH